MQTHISFNIFIIMTYLYCSYRIEHLLDRSTLKNSIEVNLVSKRIMCAINIQRQATKLV